MAITKRLQSLKVIASGFWDSEELLRKVEKTSINKGIEILSKRIENESLGLIDWSNQNLTRLPLEYKKLPREKIKWIDLSSNDLRDLPFLEVFFPNLKHLIISGNRNLKLSEKRIQKLSKKIESFWS
jgi:hypothetical protein